MKISKKKIQALIINYLTKEAKKKKISKNLKLNKIDFIDKGIIDSLGFLNLISHLEKNLKIEIDLSNENPDNLSKVYNFTNIIYKKNL
jgi:acyl carrier protein